MTGSCYIGGSLSSRKDFMLKAIIIVAGFGTMVFELFPDKAPLTVANFAQVANSGFYDGLAFCRIVKGYVVQAGSPDNDIMTDSDSHIVGEFADNGYPTGIDHRRGAVSMARDEAPDTAGTQFFIVHQDAHQLDGRYAAFGYMLSGFEVLDTLADVETSGPDTWNRPLVLPIIQSIQVETL
jgi:peptidyl-prolyl cis-trans isomerase B (cyclophilin B)